MSRRSTLVTAVALAAGAAVLGTVAFGEGAVMAQDPPDADPTGRTQLIDIPPGCEVPDLPDIVFTGTVVDVAVPAGAPATEAYETGRFEIDQVRAGDPGAFSFGGLIDVRFGNDAKYLDVGEEYLVGARLDRRAGVLMSKVRAAEPMFGGDEIIGARESDIDCPLVEDPIRTLMVDGTSVESGVLTPLRDSKPRLLRSILLPGAAAFAILFGLVTVRWLLTGVWRGAETVVRTAQEPREVRAARRSRTHHSV